MITHPSVYLYKTTNNLFELYLGGYSTLQGISLFNKDTSVRLIEFGASSYKKYGWATEKEVPVFETIGDMISFFQEESPLDLISFNVDIIGFGTLSSHDDEECYFRLNSKQKLVSIIKTVAPHLYQDKVMAALIDNPTLYITIDEEGTIRKFHTFDQYLQH